MSGADSIALTPEYFRHWVEEFSAAFKGSPMKRATLPAMKRNAAVVLGDVGTAYDVEALTRALDDPEPLAREHAAWALDRVSRSSAPDFSPSDDPPT